MAELRHRLQVGRTEKYRHDLLNAFTAIEGATTLLAEETLSEADRAILSEKYGSGVRRLRLLLATGPESDHAVLDQVAASVAGDRPWRGRVKVAVGSDLVVAGSPSEIEEALRQLLIHAGLRLPAGAITVRALRKADRIEIWVDDFGPPLSARQLRSLRRLDHPRLMGRDVVDALPLAVRLVRAQGGHLLMETRPDGTSIGISWPDAGV